VSGQTHADFGVYFKMEKPFGTGWIVGMLGVFGVQAQEQ
jgi:hypothetical protein